MDDETYRLIDLAPASVVSNNRELGEIYRDAFRIESEERVNRFLENSLTRHTEYHGYRCVAAQGKDGHFVGFVYGYHSEPGRWWHDTVAEEIRNRGHSAFLEDAFEFVEFAVLPEWQGRGIGRRLHDRILGRSIEQTALLSTDAGINPARDLYRRLGWIDLVPDFVYPAGTGVAALMGLDLAGWRARNASPA